MNCYKSLSLWKPNSVVMCVKRQSLRCGLPLVLQMIVSWHTWFVCFVPRRCLARCLGVYVRSSRAHIQTAAGAKLFCHHSEQNHFRSPLVAFCLHMVAKSEKQTSIRAFLNCTQLTIKQYLWCQLFGNRKANFGCKSFRQDYGVLECSLFYSTLLQKRPRILRSLLIIATPYQYNSPHRKANFGCASCAS